jgi:hypothetical protein
VFTLLSTLIGGVGDLGIYFVATVTAGIAQAVGGAIHSDAVARAAEELLQFLGPKLHLSQMITSSPFSFFPLVSFLSTITLCLALAVVVMNRKELSYASGG